MTAPKKIIAIVGATGAQGGGLARAILDDPGSPFTARILTRDPNSAKAGALADRGAEVVAADTHDPASVKAAFAGAWGAYCVTFFWAHLSPDKELAEARALADAARANRLQHVIWSTLEDVRTFIPLSDTRMPTLLGKYKVPHFDVKGEADRFFDGLPTTFLLASFYWENLFQMGPRPGPDGRLTLTLPMADKALAGIASEDIGRSAYGAFKAGAAVIGQQIGLAGDQLTGARMAAAMTRALGREIVYYGPSPAEYRGYGFPGAEELGNMFQFYAECAEAVNGMRDVKRTRLLNPALLSFDAWLAANASKIPLG